MLDETLTGTFLPKDQGHKAAVLARAPPHLLATYGHLRPLTATYAVVPAPNSAVSCPDYTTILSALPLARRLSVDGAFTSGVSLMSQSRTACVASRKSKLAVGTSMLARALAHHV